MRSATALPASGERGAQPLIAWLTRSSLRTWLAAFALFEAFVYAGLRLPSEAGVAVLGGLGLAGATTLLIAGQRAGQTPDLLPLIVGQRCSRWATWLGVGVVAAVGLLTTALVFGASVPIAIGADPKTYALLSESISGRRSVDLKHLTYLYPLIVASARLVWESALSVVLLQHLVRVSVAVSAFLALRSTSYVLALVASLFVAADPLTTFYAHTVLTESLYTSALLGMLLLTYFLGCRHKRPLAWAVALGALAAGTALLRPAGALLLLPLLLYLLITSRSWRRVALVGLGAAGMALCLAAGQWRVTGQLGFGTQADVYYAFPYFHYGLFDPNNGPLAAELYSYVPRDDCQFSLPTSPMQLQTVSFPQNLSDCISEYSKATGSSPLSLGRLYVEGILEHPVAFVLGVLDEMTHFVTHGDWNRLATYVYVPGTLTAYDAVTNAQCRGAVYPMDSESGAAAVGGGQSGVLSPRGESSGATLTITPNPVKVDGKDVTITWSVPAPGGELWVAQDGGPEALVASGLGGTQTVRWIQQGASYQFRLYAGEAHDRLLASVTVLTDQDYYCAGALPFLGGWIGERMPVWLKAYVGVIQPYREQGLGFWERWWAALGLLAFVLIVAPPPLRALALLCVLVIGYQAAVTAVGQWNLPRYVAVVAPEFELLTALTAVMLGAGIVRAARGAGAARYAAARAGPLVKGSLVLLLAVGGMVLGVASREQSGARAAMAAAAAYPGGIVGSDPAQRPSERAAAAAPVLASGQLAAAAWTAAGVRALAVRGDGISYQAAGGGRKLDGLALPVVALAESADGQRVGAIGADGQALVWDASSTGSGRLLATAAPARSMSFGPVGQVVVGDAEGGVSLWRQRDEKPVALAGGQQGAIVFLAASPDGRLIAAADESGKTCLWESDAARLRGCATTLQGPVVSVGWSPDGQLWATGSLDGALRVWETATAAEYGYRFVPSPFVYAVTFSPDGRQVAAATASGKVGVWTLGGREMPLEFAGWGPTVRQWERSARELLERTRAVPLWSVAWAPAGSVVVGDERGQVWRWPVLSGEEPMPIDETNRGAAALSLAVGPEGQVAVGGADRAVRLWRPDGVGAPSLLGEAGRAVYAVDWSDSTRVGATSWDGRIREWAATGALIDEQPAQGAGRAVAVAPGGQRAVGEPMGGVRLEAEEGRVVTRFAGGVGDVTALAWSADARWLAVGGAAGAVQLWDVQRGAPKVTLVGARADVTGLAFGPGDRLAAVALDGSLRVWDLAPLLGSD